jgi:nicotinate phosphoribosyltransferase
MKTKNWLFSDYSCLSMAEGLLSAGAHNTHVVYDMFFREIPNNGGFAVMAGLSVLIDELKNLKFSEEILTSLEQDCFSEKLIYYFRNFKFLCDIYSVP